MHIQARSKPAASAPDLEAFLRVLSEPETPSGEPAQREAINIEGVSGGTIELGGEFVFAVEHGRERDAESWLRERNYEPVFAKVWAQVLPSNTPGALLAAIRDASGIALKNRQVIKDVLIGQETASGDFYVQVAFQDVKTAT